MGYSRSEQETVFVFDGESNIWNVYSSVPKHIRKLTSLCELEILEVEDGRPISVKGTLNEKQVSMKKERIMSDEQKEKVAQRFKQAREN